MGKSAEIAKIARSLSSDWADYRSSAADLSSHPYSVSLSRLKMLTGIKRHNELIDYLDDHFPGWRGYPNPQVSRDFNNFEAV